MSIEYDRGIAYNRLRKAIAREIRLAASDDVTVLSGRLATAVREAIYIAAAEDHPDTGVRLGISMMEKYIHDPEAI